MKTDALKKFIKEAVKEAIQEELKDILLEAVRSPKPVVQETLNPQVFSKPNITPNIQRDLRSLIGGEFETAFSANSSHAQPSFNPSPTINTVGEGSALPGGEVSLNQIMGLMK
jgi:hypothetical protein